MLLSSNQVCISLQRRHKKTPLKGNANWSNVSPLTDTSGVLKVCSGHVCSKSGGGMNGWVLGGWWYVKI